jgi:hypothetical protein
MNECNCKFYEVDVEAQKEGEQFESGFLASMTDAEREAMEAWDAELEDSPLDDGSPLCKCGPFCKYLKHGKGFPGEYVYHCTAPDNEHIIQVDFNESELI